MRLSKAHNLNLKDGSAIYYPNFFNKNEADKYFKYLRNNLEWQQDKITVFGKTYDQPRLTAFFGNNNKPYSYSGITMYPKIFENDLLQLKNLIENGLKYNNSENPTVNINYEKTETHHKIIVSDNGIGIKKQYHEKIFEMFKRLHNRGAYEGSGIGLAIVKLSVEKLGGTVKIESEEGKGSRFVIML